MNIAAVKALTAAIAMAATAMIWPVCAGADGPYRTHKVKKNESINGIAYQYGVSADDIYSLNPGARLGLKKGMELKIPIGPGDDAADAATETPAQKTPVSTEYGPATSAEAPVDATDTPAGSGYTLSADDEVQAAFAVLAGSAETESPAEFTPAEYAPAERFPSFGFSPSGQNILISLPFTTDGTEQSRQGALYTEFYKGFLLSLQENGIEHSHLNLIVEDKGNPSAALRSQCGGDIAMSITDGKHSGIDDDYHTYSLNLFNIKDESYLTDPFSIQCNIPQHLMYERAVQAFVKEFAGYTAVILSPKSGNADKDSFVRELKKACSVYAIPVMELPFNNTLTSADLESLSPDCRYVFVPRSGGAGAFNKFYGALADLKTRATDAGNVRLFGYPEWITFKGDQKKALHALDAVYYSRVAFNPESPQVQAVENAYFEWFQGHPLEGVPNQCLLGYDAAGFIRYLLASGPISRLGMECSVDYTGLQSAFVLERHPGGGFVNTALFIVKCHPFGTEIETVR